MRFALGLIAMAVMTAMFKAIPGGLGVILGLGSSALGIYLTFAHFSRKKRARMLSRPDPQSDDTNG